MHISMWFMPQGRYLDAGSTEDDVTVYIGTDQAEVNSLDESALTVTLPAEYPGRQCIDGNRTSGNPCVVASSLLNEFLNYLWNNLVIETNIL